MVKKLGELICVTILVLVAATSPAFTEPIPSTILESGTTWVFSEPWRYRAGDDPSWASPGLDDSEWRLTTTTLGADDDPWENWDGVGWFRHRFTVDQDLVGVPLALRTRHAGALQAFVDGRRVEIDRAGLVLRGGADHIIVVRYESRRVDILHRAGFPAGFEIGISEPGSIRDLERHLRFFTGLQLFLTALPIAFAVVHVALFFHMPTRRGNLVYAALLLLWSATVFFDYQAAMAPDWTGELINLQIQRLASGARDVVLLALVYTVLSSVMPRRFWILATLTASAALLAALKPHSHQWLQMAAGALILVEMFRTVASSLRQGHRNASLFAVGITALVGFGSYDVLLDLGLMAPIAGIHNAYFIGYLVFLVCMSVFLARDFAQTHRLVFEQEQAARDREREMEILAADNWRKTKELEEARELQLSMLPASVPEVPQLAIAASMKTATEVGGDYYDFHLAPGGALTVAIGDATGHGMRAGTLVTAVKSLFSALAGDLPPARFLQRCSKLIWSLKLGRMHMAMTVVRIEAGAARIAAAGIPPALLFRANSNTIEELSAGGLPLGTGIEPDYREREVALAPGDTILLTTDGLAELNDPRGIPFEYQGVVDAFAEAATRSPSEIVRALLSAGESWMDDATQEDDITCVVLQCRPDKEWGLS